MGVLARDLVDDEVDAGQPLVEVREQWQEDAADHRLERADPHRPGDLTPQGEQPSRGALELGLDGLGRLREHLPRARQGDPGRVSVEDRDARLGFESCNLLGHRRG